MSSLPTGRSGPQTRARADTKKAAGLASLARPANRKTKATVAERRLPRLRVSA